MSGLILSNVAKRFDRVEVLHDISLEIAEGEFVVFVGPSGCGKSTLLRMIAGLESVSAGEMTFGGRRLNEVPPAKRGVAMVFQTYALYPHMTVRGNLAYGLKIARLPKAEIDRKIGEAARMLQIEELLDRRPAQLSGGQRQRVAIGRAVVRDPRLFLFDEPLSNLDAALRMATRVEIARLKEAMPRTTMLYVTHDQVEAMTMADRIVVMNGGRVEQAGAPMDLYRGPANRFVAGFLGSPGMNFVDPTRLPDLAGQLGVPEGGSLGIRPEALRLAPGEAGLAGRVILCERLGDAAILHLSLDGGLELVAKVEGTAELGRGDTARLTVSPEAVHVFDSQGLAVSRP
ncbi:ABC transporter ATP-binding protein [Histidinibacterium lentulum]|uniref:sn-glycerol-3-phosphate ABC transporter ATP-binding protein UgpC n=1 Tax=Histidinibacterium lentulum TaxID=2480588 RepID=A0A3N2R658_9RHOB|nr:sn-glycerol-3-phosphate ABC transporter ATP-binding protein UgpC [Histidinibacterium lentulum]ROU02887.1 sn-glycerol-3-phosphate ABC transporter ATP-binding protein UgpC [Histidinibacterium lentulum]